MMVALNADRLKRYRLEVLEDEIDSLKMEAERIEDDMKTKADVLSDEQYGALEDDLNGIKKRVEELEISWQLLTEMDPRDYAKELIRDSRFDEAKENRWGSPY